LAVRLHNETHGVLKSPRFANRPRACEPRSRAYTDPSRSHTQWIGVAQNSRHKPQLNPTKELLAPAVWDGVGTTLLPNDAC